MAEHPAPPTNRTGALVAGALAVAVVVIGALWMIAHKINNVPWGKSDQVLAVLVCLGALGAVGAFWRELAAVFGTRGAQYNLNAALVTILVFGIAIVVNYFFMPRFFGDVKKEAA